MLKLSRFVYCPRCGQPCIEEFRKNGMKCNACDYIYFHNTGAAVAGIIEIGGELLLTERAHAPEAGTLDLPGGFVDYNESSETALAREILEELGIAVSALQYLGSFPNQYIYKRVTYYTCDTTFICSTDAKITAINCSSEIAGYQLFAPDAIPFDKVGFTSIQTALKAYQQHRL